MKGLSSSRIPVCVLATLLLAVSARAQARLSETNSDTRVERISFRYTGTRTFDDERLGRIIATRGPGVFQRLKRRLDFVPFVNPTDFPFDPVELQRDIVRLKRFFQRNGYLMPRIDYPASQFDRERNAIHIIISINEGPPLSVQSFNVIGQDRLPEDILDRWSRFQRDLRMFNSGFYTDIERLRIEGEILSFLQDRGYAFARLNTDTRIDSTGNAVHIGVEMIPGPRARIGEIIVEGNESVDAGIVRRELPFRVGDYYSRSAVSRGQRELFGLNLFRLALADVPSQSEDSTVSVRYRVREAPPRFVSLQSGYSRETGFSFDVDARHRNFLGGARQLSLSTSTQTGFAAQRGAGRQPVESVSASVSIRQPYLWTTQLSVTFSPFYTLLNDPNQDTHFYEVGVSTAFLYEMLPFRSISLQHSFSRATPVTASGLSGRFDIYDRSIIGLGLTAGHLNDYLNPRRGFLIRPHIEGGGLLVPSGVTYVKGMIEAIGYVPVSRRSTLVLSAFLGRLTPLGSSRNQADPDTEFRFDQIRFYSGGASDVRGWGLNALGPQVALADSVYVSDSGDSRAAGARFEAVGALAKLGGSAELRIPIPGLRDRWRLGIFLDAGALSSRIRRDATGQTLFDSNGTPEIYDNGGLGGAVFQFGSGLGIRFQTPVGSIRFDVAMKLNPLDEDLWDPEEIVLYREGLRLRPPDRRNGRRFNLHLSIDQLF